MTHFLIPLVIHKNLKLKLSYPFFCTLVIQIVDVFFSFYCLINFFFDFFSGYAMCSSQVYCSWEGVIVRCLPSSMSILRRYFVSETSNSLFPLWSCSDLGCNVQSWRKASSSNAACFCNLMTCLQWSFSLSLNMSKVTLTTDSTSEQISLPLKPWTFFERHTWKNGAGNC